MASQYKITAKTQDLLVKINIFFQAINALPGVRQDFVDDLFIDAISTDKDLQIADNIKYCLEDDSLDIVSGDKLVENEEDIDDLVARDFLSLINPVSHRVISTNSRPS